MADQRTDKAPKRFIFFFLFYCKKFWYTCMYILYLTSQLIFSKNAFPNHHLAYFTIFDCSISRTLYLIYIKSLCHLLVYMYNSIWLNCIQYKFEKKNRWILSHEVVLRVGENQHCPCKTTCTLYM